MFVQSFCRTPKTYWEYNIGVYRDNGKENLGFRVIVGNSGIYSIGIILGLYSLIPY